MRKLCRACLKACDKNVQKIDEVTTEIMNILLVKLNLEITDDPAFCRKCAETLQKCFGFKSTCFYTEEFLFPFINAEYDPDRKLDLKELYMTRQDLAGLDILACEKICRFCMELMNEELLTPLCDIDLEMMHKCLPELNFVLTKEPVICDPCHNFLKLYTSFIDTCVETERKIDEYRQIKGVNKRGKVPLTKVQRLAVEGEREEIITQEYQIDAVGDIKPVKPDKIHYAECLLKVENCLKDGRIEYKGKRKRIIEYHYTKEEIERRKYACSHCSYRTDVYKTLRLHSRIHADQSRLEWYSCETCTYKTIRKHQLIRHLNSHYKQPKQIVYKKCPLCDYRARFASTVKAHMTVHEDRSKLKLYSCEVCPYKARIKASVKSHMRKHENACTYSCEECSFRSKYIESFKRHLAHHKNPNELQFVYCAQCDFKTLRKSQLKIHIMRSHRDPSKVFMYRCLECQFNTFYKGDYKRHLLIHKKRSEVTVYKCETCEYETIYKKQLRMHEVRHTGERPYGCHLCAYKARRAGDLKSHMLKHKKRSEIQLFECGVCGQSFKMKYNMRKHVLLHREREGKSDLKKV